MNKPLFPTLPALTEQELTQERADRKRANRKWHGKSWHRITVNFAILSALAIGGFVVYRYFTPLPFDSAQWKASGTYENMSIRRRMSDDLLSNKRLEGLNYFQVVSLLGRPDQHGVHDWNMGYMVGFLVIDPRMLVIKFEKDGKDKRVIACDVQTFN